MDAFVTALEADITVASLWGAIAGVAGLVAVSILVGFAYRVTRRAVRGISNGKANI